MMRLVLYEEEQTSFLSLSLCISPVLAGYRICLLPDLWTSLPSELLEINVCYLSHSVYGNL